ncbi:hypothetical protein [Desulfosporosinus nitroreducens]|uniref:hypothetical protein n=1 Tax=Desulfosporosinus nitroreducens TaxID=2018668 RepID=UPI00207D5694|nr:hypothetical protein [Desulfosporosinus nitroreducens]MCO1603655.1 hypothetical protein [Desulfosporosinus nitroreducens]
MQTTANLGLKKPEGTDVVNIQDFNDNADLLDNYAAATSILIGAKASIASPALTGMPTAPTAGVDTSTTQVATTAFVLGQAGTTAPVMNGVAGIGSSKRYARADHVHPVDMSRTGQADFAAHLADYTLQVPFKVTTGVANTYVATLTPALTSYVAGVAICVKINVANTGTSTINVNGLGAKSILDSKGSAMISGKLRLNGVYTLRYDGTSFILQGEGGEYGTAIASQVLTGYTVGTDNGLISGTMPIRAGDTAVLASSVTGTTLKLRASNGYRDGVYDNVTITDADFIDANILFGKDVFGLTGTYSNIKSIQRGSLYTVGSGSYLDIPIASVDPAKSIVKITSNYAEGDAPNTMTVIAATITSATNIRLIAYGSMADTAFVTWEVIEFNNVKSKQSGVIAGTATSATISAVDLTKSILFVSFTTENGDYDVLETSARAVHLSSPTTITLKSRTTLTTTYWQVIEFN